jgi:hypothetical protein
MRAAIADGWPGRVPPFALCWVYPCWMEAAKFLALLQSLAERLRRLPCLLIADVGRGAPVRISSTCAMSVAWIVPPLANPKKAVAAAPTMRASQGAPNRVRLWLRRSERPRGKASNRCPLSLPSEAIKSVSTKYSLTRNRGLGHH